MKIGISGPLVGAGFTQGSVIFAGVGGVLTEDNPNFFWDDTNNRLGIRTSGAPLYPLHVKATLTSIAANEYGGYFEITSNPSGNEGTFGDWGLYSSMVKTGSANISTPYPGLRAMEFRVGNSGTGTISQMVGMMGSVFNSGTGAVTTADALFVDGPSASVANPIINCGGLYISTQKITGVTTGYGVRSVGVADVSYFLGFLGAGVAAPAARLHIAAGTATAGTAPLLLTSGTSLMVTVAGSIEFTTDNLFFTITTGAARKRLIMADPVDGLSFGRIPFATTNGRLTDLEDLFWDGALFVGSTNYIEPSGNAIFSNGQFFINGVSGKISSYADIFTEGFGVPVIVDNVALTNQGAAIGSTNVTNGNVAGDYRVGYYLVCTTADITAGSIAISITYNDGTAVRTLTGVAVVLTSTANWATKFTNTNADGSYIHLGSGSIAYSTVLTGSAGTSKYALYLSFERLN